MKNFIVFILAFSLLYPVALIASGWLITVFHTADVSLINSYVGQDVVTEQYYLIPFIMIILSAILAYFLSRVLFVSRKKRAV